VSGKGRRLIPFNVPVPPHQELMDRLLSVDETEEFTVYLVPVGKIRPA
jgi:hypothetical protein